VYVTDVCGTWCFVNDTTSYVSTPSLHIAYEASGPEHGDVVLLLHGWPDDVRTYDGIVPALHAAGLRTVVPWLRGFGPTRFASPSRMRSGQIAAIAQDALDLMDALGVARFTVVGHDWGARAGYLLASVEPARVRRLAAMSLGWQPGALATPSFEQARRFWYQWFLATERGAEAVRAHPVEFARAQWETWSPPGWFTEAAFAATAPAFRNPDWPEITVHSYRVRWGEAETCPVYAELERRALAAAVISVPTLTLIGSDDRCVMPEASEAVDRYFTGPYRRHVIAGAGHFPTREAPDEVAAQLVGFLSAG
jgi:pimeloyl-ACP methyl ester carboxylesterase